MNNELILPNLVPVESQLILSPEAERERQLAAIAAEEEDYEELEAPLSERVRLGVCKACGHQKLLFLPARLCEKDLKKAAEAAGLPFPEAGARQPMNRAQRRAAVKRRKRR